MRYRKPSRARGPAAWLLLAVLGAAASSAPAQEPLRLAAGSPQGNYYQLATHLAEAAGERLDIEVLATEGSYDNARRLIAGETDAALLQSDVAYLEFFRTGDFLAAAGLGRERVHVVARRELGLERLSDLLEGTSVWRIGTGESGSGTAAQARLLLRRLGLPTERRRLLPLSHQEAIARLEARSLDIMFLTSAVPAPTVDRVAAESAVKLLEVDEDILDSARRISPFFEVCEVPWTAYPGMEHHVRTLCTRALLVVRSELADESVEGLLRALAAVLEEGTGHALLEPDLLEHDLAGLAIPAHQRAEAFHAAWLESHDPWNSRFRGPELPVLLALLVAAIVLFFLFRHSPLAHHVHRSDLVGLLVILVFVWLAGSALMLAFEGDKNSAFRSFGASSIAILHYLFSGLESKYPLTGPGNVIAIVMLILGVAIATVFTTTLVRIFVTRAFDARHLKRKRPSMLMKLKGHVVVFGWSKRTERVIAELRSKDLAIRPPVVVVDRRLPELIGAKAGEYRDVWAVDGHPTARRTLARADLDQARAVLLLERERDAPGNLSPVALALALQGLEATPPRIVEAWDEQEAECLGDLHVCEVVRTRLLTHRLMARFLVSPGTIRLYDELLSFGRDSQELYRVPLPTWLDGLTYAEGVRRLANVDALPVGYVKKEQVYLNPRREADGRGQDSPLCLADGDHLLVLADEAKVLARSGPPRRGHGEDRPERIALMSGVESDAANQSPVVHRVGICGWCEEAEEILRQLQDEVVAKHHRFSIKVIAERKRVGADRSETNGLFRNVSFVFGDPTRREVLDNAGIGDLESLVILADGSDEHADHRSLVIALTARHLETRLRIVAEVLDPANQEHFDRIGGVEVVSVQSLTEKLLAQAVISPGITEAFNQLLKASADTNEIYLLPVPEAHVGSRFQDLYLELVESEQEVVLLGYETRPTPEAETDPEPEPVQVINPRQASVKRQGVVDSRDYVLGAGDRLIVMAYEEPVWGRGSG